MRSMILFLLGVCVMGMANGCASLSKGDGESGAREGWRLVWSDEFDVDGPPNAEKWSHELGFVRNKEEQYYTDDPANVRVEGGRLIIEGHKQRMPNQNYRPVSDKWKHAREFAEYTSASINTHKKASWRYGRFEMRAKIPQGLGVWPAFWTLGANRDEVRWPRCGEIDIMEFVGHDPKRIHANVHFARTGKHASYGGKIVTPQPYDDFHIYAIEWFEDRIDFYFDEQKYHTAVLDDLNDDEDAFRKPHFILLNLALGGTWGKKIDDAIFPVRYEIDYVRVYQQR